MKKKIFSTLLMVAFTLASTSMFVSCKDYDDDINQKADKSAVAALESTLNQLKADFEAFKAEAQRAHDSFATWTAHNALQDQVNGLAQAIKDLQTEVASLAKAADVEIAINNLQAQIDELKRNSLNQDALNDLAAQLAAIDNKYAEALKGYATVDNLQAVKNDLQGQIDALKAYEQKIAEVTAALDGKLDKSVFDAFVAGLGDKYYTKDEITTIINNLKIELGDQTALSSKITELENLINGVQTSLDEFKTEINGKLSGFISADQLQAVYDYVNAELGKKADKDAVDNLEAFLNAFLSVIPDLPEDKSEQLKKFQEVADQLVNGCGNSINMLNVLLTKRVTSIVFKPEFDVLARPAIEAPALAYQPVIMVNSKGEGLHYRYTELDKKTKLGKDWNYDEANMPVLHYPSSYKELRQNPWEVIADFRQIGHVTYGVPSRAYYIINPSSVDLSSAVVGFVGNDVMWNEEVESRGFAYNNIAKPVHEKASENLMVGNVMEVQVEIPEWEAYIESLVNNYMDTVPMNAYQQNVAHVKTKGVEVAMTITDKTKIKTVESEDGKVSYIDDDAVVTSDWAVLAPAMLHIQGLADNFIDKTYQSELKKNPRDTKPDPLPKMPKCLQEGKKHLFKTAEDAIKYGYTHQVKYNGSIDLEPFVEVHYTYMGVGMENDYMSEDQINRSNKFNEAGYGYGELEQTMRKATFDQLGLYYKWYIVEYAEGGNDTGESRHIKGVGEKPFDEATGRIECSGSEFTPCSVNADGTRILDAPATREALWREPLINVELYDKTGNIIEAGFIKLQIVEELTTVPDGLIPFTFEFDDVTYVDCDKAFDKAVTWSQMENLLLAKLGDYGYSKEQFELEYMIDDETSVKQFAEATADAKPLDPKDYIGEVEYTTYDKESRETNILKWKVSDGTNIGEIYDLAKPALNEDGKLVNTVELYTWVRFVKKPGTGAGPILYVKLSIPVGSLVFAQGEFSYEKTLAYWYNLNSPEKAAADGDNIRDVAVNVPVPVFKTADWKEYTVGTFKYKDDNLLENTEFVKDLHNYFFDANSDGQGDVSLKLDNADKFPNLAKKKAVFKFTLPSTVTGNATFNANSKGEWTVNGLSVDKNGDHTKYTLHLSDDLMKIMCGDVVIVELDELGAIHFVEGEIADDILNYVTHEKRGELETFTAYIMLTTEDACYDPLMRNQLWFNVRFLRPVDMEGGSIKSTFDAPDDWQEVNLNLVSFRDWRYPDIKWKTPDYNNYYQVELLAEDYLIKTDARYGESDRKANGDLFKENLKTYPEGTLAGLKVDSWTQIDGLLIELTKNTKGEYILRYKNNSGVTSGFHIYVPVFAEYVFGRYPEHKAAKDYSPFLKAYVQVEVSKTEGNAKKN